VRIALLFLAAAACTQPRSDTCKRVCTKEYDCVTKTSATIPFDEKECIAACSALEGDPDNLAKVMKHVECVDRNVQSCETLLGCE